MYTKLRFYCRPFYRIELEGLARFPLRLAPHGSAPSWEIYLDPGAGRVRLRLPSKTPRRNVSLAQIEYLRKDTTKRTANRCTSPLFRPESNEATRIFPPDNGDSLRRRIPQLKSKSLLAPPPVRGRGRGGKPMSASGLLSEAPQIGRRLGRQLERLLHRGDVPSASWGLAVLEPPRSRRLLQEGFAFLQRRMGVFGLRAGRFRRPQTANWAKNIERIRRIYFACTRSRNLRS